MSTQWTDCERSLSSQRAVLLQAATAQAEAKAEEMRRMKRLARTPHPMLMTRISQLLAQLADLKQLIAAERTPGRAGSPSRAATSQSPNVLPRQSPQQLTGEACGRRSAWAQVSSATQLLCLQRSCLTFAVFAGKRRDPGSARSVARAAASRLPGSTALSRPLQSQRTSTSGASQTETTLDEFLQQDAACIAELTVRVGGQGIKSSEVKGRGIEEKGLRRAEV